MGDYHSNEIKDVLNELNTDKNSGLSSSEVQNRLQKYGPNILKEAKKKSLFSLFLEQFKSPVVIILIFAVIISIIIGEAVDAIVILIIVIFNAILGFIQEYKAEKSIQALKKLSSLSATVIRDATQHLIPTRDLVPGDIILLKEGDKVPADARLIEVLELQAQEASLTGESTPVQKNIQTQSPNTQIADQKNMVFSSTIITRGKARAVVVTTGMQTQIGKIATLITKVEDESTPLQQRLQKLGRQLGYGSIAVCIFIFLILAFFQNKLLDALITSVSLAVAAVPEGLPAVVTISLSLGVKKMVKKNALIRRLPSVETLGSTDVICTDKTGTLTKNEMTVTKIYVNNSVISVTGTGYNAVGEFLSANKLYSSKELELLLKCGALCNDSYITFEKKEIVGDPTELALVVSARKAKINQNELNKLYPRTSEIPFSSNTKYMVTKNNDTIYAKGAPDVILKHCDAILINKKIRRITKEDVSQILKVNQEFGSHALRVLGFAYKQDDKTTLDTRLIFIGLQAMIDPPRDSIKSDIEKCHSAGINVIMVTGDHKATAVAIAKQIGLKGNALSGEELDLLSEKELYDKVQSYDVYARVSPEHKLRIVDALKKRGHVVAVTGDGVNDAPALKLADIGIAMGITGTDVTKETSDMILTDDNFSSIVNAIQEGRTIYTNIQKFVGYLLSVNAAEILIIFLAVILRLPLPLIAIQILWMNLVTDGLPAVALSVDPSQKGVMSQKPRRLKENILNKHIIFNIIVINILVAAGIFSLFLDELPDIKKAQTITFSALVIFEMVALFFIRHALNTNIFTNKYLYLAVSSSIILQLIVVYSPLNIFFKTVPISLADWLEILMFTAGLIVAYMVIYKFVNPRTQNTRSDAVKS